MEKKLIKYLERQIKEYKESLSKLSCGDFLWAIMNHELNQNDFILRQLTSGDIYLIDRGVDIELKDFLKRQLTIIANRESDLGHTKDLQEREKKRKQIEQDKNIIQEALIKEIKEKR